MLKRITVSLIILTMIIVPNICFAEENIYTTEDNESTIDLLDVGETMENNNGNITLNKGTIDYNLRNIETNEGTVKNNENVIRYNTGTVINNYSYNLLKNDGIVVNDYIVSTANRNYLNAQNTFYLVDFGYINENIVEIKWNGPIDPKGNYYYGVSTNLDESQRGASFALNIIDEGYEFKGIESDKATLTKVGENIYEISYNEESSFEIKIKYLPVLKEIQSTGGQITRTKAFENEENYYMYVEYKIVPDNGYEIEDVLVNGQSVGVVERYELYDVTSPTTVKAVFRKIPPAVPNTNDNGIFMWSALLILSLISLIALFITNKKRIKNI